MQSRRRKHKQHAKKRWRERYGSKKMGRVNCAIKSRPHTILSDMSSRQIRKIELDGKDVVFVWSKVLECVVTFLPREAKYAQAPI